MKGELVTSSEPGVCVSFDLIAALRSNMYATLYAGSEKRAVSVCLKVDWTIKLVI